MEWPGEAFRFGTQVVVCFHVFIYTLYVGAVYVCDLQQVKSQPGVKLI